MDKACECDPKLGIEVARGRPGICSKCGGHIGLKLKLEWLRERIYRPREFVRARELTNGNWEVFDGVAIHTLTEKDFRENYELASQTQKKVKEHGQYEYHRS